MTTLWPKRILVLLLSITTFLQSTTAAPNFIDAIPLISQGKSLVLWTANNSEEAKRVQEYFAKNAVGFSQLYSLAQILTGNPDGALETQKGFLYNTVVPLIDAIPGVGHVKGALQKGDEEAGIQAIQSATRTTGILLGGALAGPGGAVAGALASDGLFTGLES